MSDIPQSLQIASPLREDALQECRVHLKRWQIALPPTDPLVLDFGLGQFRRVGLYEFWIANELQAGYCGKYMFLLDGQMCPRHYHRVKHETFFVLQGKLDITLDDERRTLNGGETLAVEPGRVHSFAGNGPALMLELSMPCDPKDNYFEEPQTMKWLRENLGIAT